MAAAFFMNLFGRITGRRALGSSIKDSELESDNNYWHTSGKHWAGDYSFAALKGNPNGCEDFSQIEKGNSGLFAGVYDGHGGRMVAELASNRLFNYLIDIATTSRLIEEGAVALAIRRTENEFLAEVEREYNQRPEIAGVGSCCLVAFFLMDTLFVGNLGDSRAVLGHRQARENITAQALTTDHNASNPLVQQELRDRFPDIQDQIVCKVNNAPRVMGIIQVSRCLGDAFMKVPNRNVPNSRFQVPRPVELDRPYLSAEPQMVTVRLHREHRFLILASDGLWDYISNEEAAQIVFRGPKQEAAKRLIKAALERATLRHGRSYRQIKESQDRRQLHDDITVVVIFIKHEKLKTTDTTVPVESVRVFYQGAPPPSEFSRLEDVIRRPASAARNP